MSSTKRLMEKRWSLVQVPVCGPGLCHWRCANCVQPKRKIRDAQNAVARATEAKVGKVHVSIVESVRSKRAVKNLPELTPLKVRSREIFCTT